MRAILLALVPYVQKRVAKEQNKGGGLLLLMLSRLLQSMIYILD